MRLRTLNACSKLISIALLVLVVGWVWSTFYELEFRAPIIFLGQVTYEERPQNEVCRATPDTTITSMISLAEGQLRVYVNRIIPKLNSPENSILRFRTGSPFVFEPISNTHWFVRLGFILPEVSCKSQKNGAIATFTFRAPLWAIFMLLVALQMVLRKKLLVRMRKVACTQCDYDLRGCVSNVCPECGALISIQPNGASPRYSQ